MNLTFYNTGFRPEYNGVYEEIETYLSTLTPTYSTEYKFIDPALNVVIKIDASSHQFDTRNIGNFVRATDGSNIWYYFVMNCQWRGKETLLLELGLDTLNTFWKELKFSNESHITRRYKDRFIEDHQGRGIPVVDAYPEEISTPPQIRTSKKVIGDPEKWYLIYKTDYVQTSELSENPVSCYTCAETEQTIATQNVGTVSWPAASMASNVWYALYGQACAGFTVKFAGQNFNIKTVAGRENYLYFYKESNTAIKLVYVEFPVNPQYGDMVIQEYSAGTIEFLTATFVYMQQSNHPTKPTNATEAGKILAGLDNSTQVWLMAGTQYTNLSAFSDWYNHNKTDSRIVRIIQLPYAPFQKETTTDGRLVIPDGWTPEDALLKLANPNIEFRHTIATETVQIPELDIEDFTPQHAPLGATYEPKLYNSAFSSFKFMYDSNVYVFNPEENPDPVGFPNSATITFHASTTLDNTLAFEFDTYLNQTQDYGEFLISNRSNSIPYYTNDYLHYLRFGKAVDERQAGFNIAGAAVRGLGGTLSTAASIAGGIGLAIGKGAAVGGGALGVAGAIAGGVIGLVSTAVGISQTNANARDSINSKIDQYTHQASNVNGTSDVSIFDIYGKNKLLYVTYSPREEFKNAIYDYFRYYGYACDEYGDIKQMYTRVYSDYFVVEPVFEDALLWTPYKDDISARLKFGIRVYHYKNGYDFKLAYENWEKAIYDDWSN